MQSFHPNLAAYRRMGYRIDLLSYLLWSESYLTLHQRIHSNKRVQELEIPQEILLRPFPTENVVLGLHKLMSAEVKIPSRQRCEEYVRDMNKILSLESNDLSGQSVKRRKEISAENKNKEESVSSSFVNSGKDSIFVGTGKRKRRSSSSSAQESSTSASKTQVINSAIVSSGEGYGKMTYRETGSIKNGASRLRFKYVETPNEKLYFCTGPTKKRRLGENDGSTIPLPVPMPIIQLEDPLAKDSATSQVSEDNLKIHGGSGTANIKRH